MAKAPKKSAMAIAAHPDDIEFLMAGTLLLLKERGYEIHYMNLSSGNCGSMVTGPAETRRIRLKEGKAAAKLLGATFHAPIADDLEIIYSVPLIRKVASAIRKAAPQILLVPSPQDYMEDHTETCRIGVTAAFARGMPNFKVKPKREPILTPITVYHAMPHGLVDGMGVTTRPELFVDTESTQEIKRRALELHRSQKDWLDETQGMGSYVQVMDEMSLAVGAMSGRFKYAEGWRKHSHLGFCEVGADPLREVLGESCLRVIHG